MPERGAASYVRPRSRTGSNRELPMRILASRSMEQADAAAERYGVPAGDLMENAARFDGFVLSVDLPSGLAADSGRVEAPVVRADVTVALAAPKLCHALSPARDFCGDVVVAEIGIPAGAMNEALAGEDGERIL